MHAHLKPRPVPALEEAEELRVVVVQGPEAAPVGASAAWLTPEAPARMATPKAVQNGTLQNNSRRSPEDVMTGSPR